VKVIEEAEGDVQHPAGDQGADDLGAQVVLDGEGDLHVHVVLAGEIRRDLLHALVFFLVIALVPPDDELRLLPGPRTPRKRGPDESQPQTQGDDPGGTPEPHTSCTLFFSPSFQQVTSADRLQFRTKHSCFVTLPLDPARCRTIAEW